jgi:hypothetical protein
LVEIALETAGGSIGGPVRADLDAAVGGGMTGDAEFAGEFEIVNGSVPPEPFAAVEAAGGKVTLPAAQEAAE